MLTQISKWGNSQAVRIPQKIMKEAGFSPDETLEVEASYGQLVLRKWNRRLSLEERIATFGPIADEPEIDWGEPVGDERW